jgi:hypothetical protein
MEIATRIGRQSSTSSPERADHDADEQGDRRDFGAIAKKAVTGVGAPS